MKAQLLFAWKTYLKNRLFVARLRKPQWDWNLPSAKSETNSNPFISWLEIEDQKPLLFLITFLITETQANTPVVYGASISVISSHFQGLLLKHMLQGHYWHRGSQHGGEHVLQKLASTFQLQIWKHRKATMKVKTHSSETGKGVQANFKCSIQMKIMLNI